MSVSESSAPTNFSDLEERWRGLTSQLAKYGLYAEDPYFRECWHDVCETLGALAYRVLQRLALVLLRPDAVIAEKGASALELLAELGFLPVAVRSVSLGRLAIRELWRFQWNGATLDSLELSDLLLTESPSVLILLQDLGATSDALPASVRLAYNKGTTQMGTRRSGDLRVRLGSPNRFLSLIHVADEPADVVRELGILCERGDRVALLHEAGVPRETSRLAAEISELAGASQAGALDTAGAIVRCRAALAGGSESANQHREEAASLLELACEGQALPWRRFAAELKRSGAQVSTWDLVLTGSALVDHVETVVEPLIPSSGYDGWVYGEGRVVG